MWLLSGGGGLGIHYGGASHVVLWGCVWRRGPKGNNASCLAVGQLSVTSPTIHKHIGPFWCEFLGGRVYVHSRTLWVSLMNSPMKLRVSPTTATPTDFYRQRFWGFISQCWKLGLRSLSCSPVVPSGTAHKCGTTWSTSRHLAASLLCPGCLCLPLLPVWMNVCSLTAWLLDFHTVWFSGSSGHFFVFKFVVVLFLVEWGGKAYLPMLPSWLEDYKYSP